MPFSPSTFVPVIAQNVAATNARNAILTPDKLGAVGTVPAPTVHASSLVAVGQVAAVATVPAPTVQTTSFQTVMPSTVVALGHVPSVTIDTGASLDYETEVLADSPFIYYRLNEASGTAVIDDSGNGNDGTYVGGPTLNQTGLLVGDADTSVNFNNINETVDRHAESAALSISFTTFTLEAWVNFNDLRESWGYQFVTGMWELPGSATDIEISLSKITAGVNKLGTYDYADGQPATQIVGPNVTTNTTYHAVVVYDATDVILYINGIEWGRDGSHPGQTYDLAAHPRRFLVGADGFGVAPDGGDGVYGRVDEAAFYTHAVSAQRVLVHYLAGKALSDTADYGTLVAADSPQVWLRCNDASGSLTDSSGNGYDAAVSFGTPTYQVTGLELSDGNKAFQFAAGTEVRTTHDFGAINPQSFTFETIVNLSAYETSGATLCGFIGENDIFMDGSGNVYGRVKDQDTNGHITAAFPLALNTTYHLALTFDGATGAFKFFINGSLADAKYLAGVATSWLLNGGPEYFYGALNTDLAATCDEIAWYPTALADDRILLHYLALAA